MGFKEASVTFAVVAIVMGAFAWRLYRQVEVMSFWPTAPGTVVKSELQHTQLDSVSRKRHLALVPNIEYEFEANGQGIIASRVSNNFYNQYVNSLETPPSPTLRHLLQKYPVGEKVTVHYNPHKPASATLEIDLSGVTFCGITSIAAALGSLICLFLAF